MLIVGAPNMKQKLSLSGQEERPNRRRIYLYQEDHYVKGIPRRVSMPKSLLADIMQPFPPWRMNRPRVLS